MAKQRHCCLRADGAYRVHRHVLLEHACCGVGRMGGVHVLQHDGVGHAVLPGISVARRRVAHRSVRQCGVIGRHACGKSFGHGVPGVTYLGERDEGHHRPDRRGRAHRRAARFLREADQQHAAARGRGPRGLGRRRFGCRRCQAAGPMEACLRGGRTRRGPVRCRTGRYLQRCPDASGRS